MKDFDIRPKILKVLGENIQKALQGLGINKDILKIITVTHEIKPNGISWIKKILHTKGI